MQLDCITNDDEVWLVQCPPELNLSALENCNIDIGNSSSSFVCEIKCKGKTKKAMISNYQSHSIKAESKINLILPSTKKSAKLNSLTIHGRVFITEDC